MKVDHFPSRLVLSAGVAVSLGLSYVSAPAQDMPPLPAAPVAEQLATQGSSVAPADAPANLSAALPQILAQSSPQAAPATPPAAMTPTDPSTAAAPADQPAAAEPSAQALAPAAPASPRLTEAELAQLLAPIALYPDQLLGQILMASSYPVEIVEAARWVAVPAHRALKGEALSAALRDRNWDPSVMALVPFPHVLELMNARIEWTEKLGGVFVAQQSDAMNEVQRLRQQAVDAGNFKSGPQCGCIVERKNHYIAVAPANPDIIYPPVYNPVAIYGPWPYPAYPPYLFPVPVGFAFAPGFFIGFGYGVDIAYYRPWWGWWNFNWSGGNLIVNNTNFTVIAGGRAGFAGGVWTHHSTVTTATSTTRATTTTTRAISGTSVAGAGRTATGSLATRSTAATSTRTSVSRAAILGRATSGTTAVTHAAVSGRTAWRGGASARAMIGGHAAWAGGHGGRFGSAAPIRGGGGPVHMAAGGGFGHGGGQDRRH